MGARETCIFPHVWVLPPIRQQLSTTRSKRLHYLEEPPSRNLFHGYQSYGRSPALQRSFSTSQSERLPSPFFGPQPVRLPSHLLGPQPSRLSHSTSGPRSVRSRLTCGYVGFKSTALFSRAANVDFRWQHDQYGAARSCNRLWVCVDVACTNESRSLANRRVRTH